jgi:hypothetical protein
MMQSSWVGDWLLIGDWLYGHFEAYILDPDRSRPDTSEGRCRWLVGLLVDRSSYAVGSTPAHAKWYLPVRDSGGTLATSGLIHKHIVKAYRDSPGVLDKITTTGYR